MGYIKIGSTRLNNMCKNFGYTINFFHLNNYHFFHNIYRHLFLVFTKISLYNSKTFCHCQIIYKNY